ncbi:hypothetical protein B0H21DRAFT_699550 [Amylocystis lapponica]|nr:hypothetical protein B0H21DRAFT_699550 [Amylocystis lapponica]
MSDLLSLSVFQVLSVLSFFTSVLAVVCVGSGSLHRLSHKLGADFNMPVQAPVTADMLKQHLWSWNGLSPVSFSLGTLIGEDAQERGMKSILGGYIGGGDLMRMNWQVGRPRFGPPVYDAHAPLSMAKLIMSRHSQRRPPRVPRRAPGMPRPTPPSRLVESVV